MNYLWRVATVGVKELKTHLSRYLRAVERREVVEVVIVTERDEIVAELRAPAVRGIPEGARDALAALAAHGEITRAAPGKGRWRWSAARLGLERALHLATYTMARERIAGLEMLTADECLRAAVGG